MRGQGAPFIYDSPPVGPLGQVGKACRSRLIFSRLKTGPGITRPARPSEFRYSNRKLGLDIPYPGRLPRRPRDGPVYRPPRCVLSALPIVNAYCGVMGVGSLLRGSDRGFGGVVGRPRSAPGGRPNVLGVRLSDAELADLDARRGSVERGAFLRYLLLRARKADFRLPELPKF